MTEEWGIEDWLPTELLCYAFTFLSSRAELKAVGLVCWRWNEALTVDEIWQKNFIRFFGTVETNIASTIENWQNIYRRRGALMAHLDKVGKPSKLVTVNEKIYSVRMLGGHNRPILVFTSGQPRIVFLTTGHTCPIPALDTHRTCVFPSADGRRLLVGTNSGQIFIWQWIDKYTYKETVDRDKEISKEVQEHVTNMVAEAAVKAQAAMQNKIQTRAQALIDVTARMNEAIARVRNPRPAEPGVAQPALGAPGHIPLTANQINQQVTQVRQQYETKIASLQPYTPDQIKNELATQATKDLAEATKWAQLLLPVASQLTQPIAQGGSYVQVGFFTDGHNHFHNMNLAIEQISENDKFVVTLAHNNTVAIWEKVAPPYNAYGYAPADRRTLGWSGRAVPYGKRGPYLKSMLFKFPPSLIYMMPGRELMVVIAMSTGKVLVWQTYSNFLLKGHTEPVQECLGFFRGDSTFLTTVSYKEGICSIKIWDLTPGMEKLGPERKPIAEATFNGKLRKLLYDSSSDVLITHADDVLIWNPFVLGDTSAMVPMFSIDKKASCISIDRNKGLLFLAQEDGFINIYFLATCQIVARLTPSRSNQYSAIFDFVMDPNTFVAADDHCIHWKVLGKLKNE